ncbi:MAG: energy transducer TonB [Bacteroidetes bacterium]|nr:energy transducer TonB [Bacteroidota bacterium]
MINVFYILLLFSCFEIFSQQPQKIRVKRDSVPATVVFTESSEQPSFPGGMSELHKFAAENMIFPAAYKNDSLFKNCTVYVKFMVEENGEISNPQIIKGCFGFDACDKEVLRLISIMPRWIPATVNGKPVRRAYSIPLRFKLQ